MPPIVPVPVRVVPPSPVPHAPVPHAPAPHAPRTLVDITGDIQKTREAIMRAEARLREDQRIRAEQVANLRALSAELAQALAEDAP